MMRGGIRFLKSVFGPHKFVSIPDRVSMNLHSKLDSFLRVKTGILGRIQTGRAVSGSTRSLSHQISALPDFVLHL